MILVETKTLLCMQPNDFSTFLMVIILHEAKHKNVPGFASHLNENYHDVHRGRGGKIFEKICQQVFLC